MLVAFSFGKRLESVLFQLVRLDRAGPVAWAPGQSPLLSVARILQAQPPDLRSLGFLVGLNGLATGYPPGVAGFRAEARDDRITLRVAARALDHLGRQVEGLSFTRRVLNWNEAIGAGLRRVHGALERPFAYPVDRLLRSGAFLGTGWLIDHGAGRRDRGVTEIAEQLGRESAACEVLARLIEWFEAETEPGD